MPSPAAPNTAPPNDPDRQARTVRNEAPNAENRIRHLPEPGQDPDESARNEPRQPNDRDESSSSQAGGPSAVGKQALKDVERGLVDTDKRPAMDRAYEDQKTPGNGSR